MAVITKSDINDLKLKIKNKQEFQKKEKKSHMTTKMIFHFL